MWALRVSQPQTPCRLLRTLPVSIRTRQTSLQIPGQGPPVPPVMVRPGRHDTQAAAEHMTGSPRPRLEDGRRPQLPGTGDGGTPHPTSRQAPCPWMKTPPGGPSLRRPCPDSAPAPRPNGPASVLANRASDRVGVRSWLSAASEHCSPVGVSCSARGPLPGARENPGPRGEATVVVPAPANTLHCRQQPGDPGKSWQPTPCGNHLGSQRGPGMKVTRCWAEPLNSGVARRK